MKAEDMKLGELVQFEEGAVRMHGRRLIVHDFRAMGQLQRDLVTMLGPEQSRRIITRFGYFWGQADASTMLRIFQWDDSVELLKAGPRLLQIQGVAQTEYAIMEMDESRERYHMVCRLRDSGLVHALVSEMGKTEKPSCWYLAGYLSGFSSFCLGKSVYFIEETCSGAGDALCTLSGKDVDTWGNEIDHHIDYFHIEDIHGKILKYSSQIREMEEKLALQRKLLERAYSGSSLGTVEIRSLQFQQIMNLATKVAKFDSSVLITGETGVGKDMLARHIHKFSPRVNGPFVAINCAALTDTLLESELFGHKAGSFTGATRDKRGLFEEANNGVIFLDEIGDISPNMQMKLLRVLQEREILRVGDTKPIKVDFRLISATNRDLEQAVADSSFRDDLYYRLQVIHIIIPPLRERREDILPLARYFVEMNVKKLRLAKLILDSTCIDYLLEYHWPGNIRELENAIEHASIMSTDGVIMPEHLPRKIVSAVDNPEFPVPTNLSLEAAETEHIRKVLELTGGNREETARILKIGVATLYRKLAAMKKIR